MKRGTSGDDLDSASKRTATEIKVESPGGNKAQVCAAQIDDQSLSQQKHLPSSSKKQDALTDHQEGPNERFLNDKKKLLEILHEELWLLVFEKLDSCDDLEGVSNSSTFFRHLLLPERVNFLFKNVWGIVGWEYREYFRTDADQAVTSDTARNEDASRIGVLEAFSPNRRIKGEVLKLRLVCRSWCNGIDKIYENRVMDFQCIPHQPDLLSHFDVTHGSATARSPFLGKSVKITFVSSHLRFPNNELNQVFEKYGQHFWNCCFHVHMDWSSILFCSRFKTLLQRMPNLITLKIAFETGGSCYTSLTSDHLQELEAETNANPFLPLRRLQNLRLENVPLSIFRQLIRTTANLDHAVLDRPLVSNLKSLSVSPCTREDFEMISGAEFDWRLTKLSLDLGECVDTQWQSVFNALQNQLGNTLAKLSLTLPEITSKGEWERVFEESKNCKLYLPNLTRLVLRVAVGNLPCLDFLLPMKDLRFLCVSVRKTRNGETWMEKVEPRDGDVVKSWSCLQCPFESNVWTLFPKLEQLQIWGITWPEDERCGHKFSFSHTRHEWKKEMQNKNGTTLEN